MENKENAPLFRGVLVDVYPTGEGEICRHRGAVAVLCQYQGKIPLVRQYRYAQGKECVELPAGKLEEGEDPKECARRELFEETGLSAGKLEELGVYCSSPDVLEEKMHLYWAEDLSLGQARPDEGEFLEGEFWELPRLKDALSQGEIGDAKTLCALFLAREKGLLSL